MSNLDDLLSRLRSLGIRLWVEEGQLKYRAPKNSLTPELLGEIKLKKLELIATLSSQLTLVSEIAPGFPERPLQIPLSFSQQRLWFLFRMEETGSAYNISAALRFRGDLDLSVLKQCFETIVQRHEILRTLFAESDDGVPFQSIEKHLDLPWTVNDISQSPGNQDRLLAAMLEESSGIHFNLRALPLFRIQVLRIGPEDHVLSLVMHHVVADGWSIGIIIDELAALYPQIQKGLTYEKPALALQFADFALQQRVRATGPFFQQERNFWIQQLTGAPFELDLPIDFPRSQRQTFAGTIFNFPVKAGIADRLHPAAAAAGTTPFMILLAAFGVALSRWSGQKDLLIGTTSANRQRGELEPMIGFFVNTLALRINLKGNPTFSELLTRVKSVCLDCYDHQEFPFEQVVDALQPARSLNRPPLVQVIFRVENSKMVGDLQFPGIQSEPVELPRRNSTFDISLSFAQSTQGWEGAIEYNTDLFEASTIHRLASQVLLVAEQLLNNPGSLVSDCILSNPEELELLAEFEFGPQLEIRHENIVSAFRESASRHAPFNAVVFENVTLTYQELDIQSSSLASHLASLGVRREDVVAICLPRGVELIVALIGILKSGAAYLPLDLSHPRERHLELLRATGTKVVVTQDSATHAFAGFQTVNVNQTHDFLGEYLISSIFPNQSAYIIFTSGSTGTPKGVVIEHQSVLNLVQGLNHTIYRSASKPLHVALVAPVVFDASVQQIFSALLLGHTLHLVDESVRKDGSQLWKFFQDRQIHLTDGTPAMLNLLVGSSTEGAIFDCPQHFVIGGEALPRSLAIRLLDCAPHALLTNIYGPTECCVDTTSLEFISSRKGGSETVPIGRPLANAFCYIMDEFGRRVPVGTWGELFIGGISVGRGYWNRPDQTAERFLPDPFSTIPGARMYRTGDITRFASDGLIEFSGRSDNQVKVNGFRIELAEVDMNLQQHPGVRLAASFVRPIGSGNELVACLVPRGSLTMEDVRSFLESRVPSYLVPSQFFIAAELPLNSSGKLDRNQLRKMNFVAALPSDVRFVAPRNEVEKAIAAAWEKVLGRGSVGVHDNFFFSGGDSIKALQIVSGMRQHQLSIEVKDIFIHPTIESLAPRVSKIQSRISSERPVPGLFPVTPVQAEFLKTFTGDIGHFNQAVLLANPVEWNETFLRDAWNALHLHHDGLRTRLSPLKGGFVSELCDNLFPTAFEVVDLRLSGDPEAELTAHAQIRQSKANLETGPLFHAFLYKLPLGQRLLLIGHHWIVDGVSWRILLEDFATAYHQVFEGEKISLPDPTHSFQAWSKALEFYGRNSVVSESKYWAGVENQSVPRLATDFSQNVKPSPASIRITIDSKATSSLLTGANASYRTEINDLLLTALIRAVLQWKGHSRIAVLLEGHGREQIVDGIDLSRTVGWFTTLFPVVLEIDQNRELGWQIKQVKESLRAVPSRGIGYGVLKHLTPPELKNGIEFKLEPQISFNYLGESQGEGGSPFGIPATEDIGPLTDPAAKSRQDLELVGMTQNGIFEMTFHFDANTFYQSSIESFSAGFRNQLLAIIDHATSHRSGEITPSDIDHKGFDLDKLEHFLKQF